MAAIKYPRKRFVRGLLRLLGRFGLPLLTQLELNDLERFPQHGPVIVVGNHTGTMEVVLMTVYARRPIEYLGSVDIPHPTLVDVFTRIYGMIPIHRGNASRASLQAGLSVLDQGGVLGLFPQGGIWEPSIQRIQTGVAWLSYRSGAPVLPIGFNATEGALDATFRLQRPRLTMHVGELLAPVEISQAKPRKKQLEQAAWRIMQAIWDLVPAEDQPAQRLPQDESFHFQITFEDGRRAQLSPPKDLVISEGAALSKFLHRPTLFNNLLINLELPIEPLRQLHRSPSVAELLTATSAIIQYLEHENPYYFTYRYGQREGTAMEDGVRQLHRALLWAQEQAAEVHATAVRSYQDPVTGEKVTQQRPQEA